LESLDEQLRSICESQREQSLVEDDASASQTFLRSMGGASFAPANRDRGFDGRHWTRLVPGPESGDCQDACGRAERRPASPAKTPEDPVSELRTHRLGLAAGMELCDETLGARVEHGATEKTIEASQTGRFGEES